VTIVSILAISIRLRFRSAIWGKWLGLKIVEIPIAYKETNVWDNKYPALGHGLLLLKMLVFAAKKSNFFIQEK
jgi:hypothetical protein